MQHPLKNLRIDEPSDPLAVTTPAEAASWLDDTPLLQCGHPTVRILARRLTQLRDTAPAKAVSCFRFVRGLRYACSRHPALVSAIDVLAEGCGDAYTKGTLFVSMLRALGIPARIRVVSLPCAVYHGLIVEEDQTVEHAYTEVLLDGAWVGVDGYVLDRDLALSAKVRLRREKRRIGYGLHIDGSMSWDGRQSSFSQFHWGDPDGSPRRGCGPFNDASEYFRMGGPARGQGWAWRVRSEANRALVNHRIETLRAWARR